MTIDAWLNVIGISGVAFYLLAYLLLRLRLHRREDKISKIMRFVGLVMIAFPLGVRWYLSASLLQSIGILMALASLLHMARQRMR